MMDNNGHTFFPLASNSFHSGGWHKEYPGCVKYASRNIVAPNDHQGIGQREVKALANACSGRLEIILYSLAREADDASLIGGGDRADALSQGLTRDLNRNTPCTSNVWNMLVASDLLYLWARQSWDFPYLAAAPTKYEPTCMKRSKSGAPMFIVMNAWFNGNDYIHEKPSWTVRAGKSADTLMFCV